MANRTARLGQSIGWALLMVPLGIGFMPQGSLSAAPQNWVKVVTNPRTKLDYYIDRGSVKKEPGFSYFWLYINSSAGQPLGTENRTLVYGLAAYLSADCQQANFRMRSVELLNQQGQQIGQENRGDFGPLRQFNRRSLVGRSVLNYVCSR